MRRRPTGEPTALPSQSLHPNLQGVLQSLDVGLDEELARYRKSRLRKVARKPGLPAVANAPRPVPPPPPPHRGITLASVAGSTPVLPLPAMPDVWEESGQEAGTPATTVSISHAIADEAFQESSDQLLHGLSTPELENREPSEPGMLSSLLTPLGIGSLLLLLLSSVTFGYLLMNPASLWFLGGNSASSPSNSGAPSGGTPPGSSANLPTSPNLANQEFVDLNLDNLSNLPVKPSPTAPVAVPTSPTVVGAGPLVVPASPVPAEPAVTVPRQSEPEASRETPQAPRATAPEPRDSRPTRRARRTRRTETAAAPEPSRSSRSSQTVATPTPSAPVRSPAASPAPVSAAAANSAPVASTVPASPAPSVATAPAPATASPRPGRYYVVTEYSGDRSLNRARRAVNDAYVRNFNSGAKVQMGVFSEAERAEELTQDLQRRGIPAQVLREGN
jgi:hypothetical protein